MHLLSENVPGQVKHPIGSLGEGVYHSISFLLEFASIDKEVRDRTRVRVSILGATSSEQVQHKTTPLSHSSQHITQYSQ